MIRARPTGLRRRFFLAAFAGAGAAAAALAFRRPAQRFLCAAAMRRRAAERAMRFGRFTERDRDRPLEAPRPGDQHTNATPERVRGNPGFVRLSEARSGGGNGRIEALPAGGGEANASGAAAVPPCALSAAGRLGAALVRPTAHRGATAGADSLAALAWRRASGQVWPPPTSLSPARLTETAVLLGGLHRRRRRCRASPPQPWLSGLPCVTIWLSSHLT
jgi:hypothetical protein